MSIGDVVVADAELDSDGPVPMRLAVSVRWIFGAKEALPCDSQRTTPLGAASGRGSDRRRGVVRGETPSAPSTAVLAKRLRDRCDGDFSVGEVIPRCLAVRAPPKRVVGILEGNGREEVSVVLTVSKLVSVGG